MNDHAMNAVLAAIFSACGECVDIAMPDRQWLDQLSPELRQAAVETQLGQLAAYGFIRRSPGYAAVTLAGLQYHYANAGRKRKAG